MALFHHLYLLSAQGRIVGLWPLFPLRSEPEKLFSASKKKLMVMAEVAIWQLPAVEKATETAMETVPPVSDVFSIAFLTLSLFGHLGVTYDCVSSLV